MQMATVLSDVVRNYNYQLTHTAPEGHITICAQIHRKQLELRLTELIGVPRVVTGE
jgi:hypothetical protein